MGGQQASVSTKLDASRNCIRQYAQIQGTALQLLVLNYYSNVIAAMGKIHGYRYNLKDWSILSQASQ
jgi:hypothetical protein